MHCIKKDIWQWNQKLLVKKPNYFTNHRSYHHLLTLTNTYWVLTLFDHLLVLLNLYLITLTDTLWPFSEIYWQLLTFNYTFWLRTDTCWHLFTTNITEDFSPKALIFVERFLEPLGPLKALGPWCDICVPYWDSVLRTKN